MTRQKMSFFPGCIVDYFWENGNMHFFKNLIPFNPITAPGFTIEVFLELDNNQLRVEFQVSGDIESLVLPDRQKARRVIGLWESTCFELFIKNPRGEDYVEFNFSPEGLWNCFYFPRPKAPLKAYEHFPDPRTEIEHTNYGLRFKATVDLSFLPIDSIFNAPHFEISTPCVLESNEGRLTYWAYSHHNEFPNFHNFSTFLPYYFDPNEKSL